MSIETYYPVEGRITLYSYNHHREPVRITATALTDLEGDLNGCVRISNWKIEGLNEADRNARATVTLILSEGDGYQTERTFPCELKETTLPSPGRSFRWSEFGGCWVHKKTGVKVVNV